mmetsp:Transcript_8284/g.27879  ORF Transcript_8284/g.27879 Transcript_8284/m.27879 type:complete len:93 (+) Transcript_8284:46-324(+)
MIHLLPPTGEDRTCGASGPTMLHPPNPPPDSTTLGSEHVAPSLPDTKQVEESREQFSVSLPSVMITQHCKANSIKPPTALFEKTLHHSLADE